MKNELLIKQVAEIIDKNVPLYSNLANVAALLYTLDNINWAGFYLAEDDVLYLGPFQGEVACTRIPFNKGVCGYSAFNKKPIIVPDVNKFEGHIACSSKSKSEIVIPLLLNYKVLGVIDIDAPIYNRFNEDDLETLQEIADLVVELFKK